MSILALSKHMTEVKCPLLMIKWSVFATDTDVVDIVHVLFSDT